MTRFCARTGISPNLVTAISLVFVLAAMALFWRGQFGAGLAFAWAMCFLDTVDGKLARVTLRSTPFGNVFDHGIDLIHPPFWYWAWYHGLGAAQLDLSDKPCASYLALLLDSSSAMSADDCRKASSPGCSGSRSTSGGRSIPWFREIHLRGGNPNLFILTVATIAGMPRDQGFLCGRRVDRRQLHLFTPIRILAGGPRQGRWAVRRFPGSRSRSLRAS